MGAGWNCRRARTQVRRGKERATSHRVSLGARPPQLHPLSLHPLSAAALVALLILALASPFIVLAGHRARLAAAPPHLRRLPGPVLADLPQFGGDHASSMLWGTYRPGLYTGIRARVPRSLLAGVMWFDADGGGAGSPSPPPIRHLAEERDGLRSFGWRVHDGETGGLHSALDGRANVSTAFLKRPVAGVYGGDWVVRLSVSEVKKEDGGGGGGGGDAPPPPPRVSTLFYLADEDGPGTRWAAPNGRLAVTRAAGEGGALTLSPSRPTLLASGRSAPVGRWALHAVVSGGESGSPSAHPLAVRPARAFTHHFHNLSSLAASLLETPLAEDRQQRHAGRRRDADAGPRPAVVELVDAEAEDEGRPGNAAFFQVTGAAPFSVDFIFTPGLAGGEAVVSDGGEEDAPPSGLLGAAKAAWRAEMGGPGRGGAAGVAPGFQAHPAAEPLPARLAALSGRALTAALADLEAAFDARFEAAFGSRVRAGAAGLAGGGGGGGGGISSSPEEPTVALSRAALANLLGGLGYFHGRPLVRLRGPRARPSASLPSAPAAIEGPPATLFTAVPARAFFPRGFLWDEGFHHLLLARWSPALSRDALAHWLDLVSTTGWIAREQILGDEARARVPAEFLAQDPAGANPPTLLLPLAAMARRVAAAAGGGDHAQAADEAAFLAAAFPRVAAWVDWFLTTQAAPGGPAGAYAWRGRDAGAGGGRELNPKTLTSGLDDFPRPSHPGPGERHVDVLCWAALAARSAAAVGRAGVGEGGTSTPPPAVSRFEAAVRALGDPAHLAALHWDAGSGTFADWGSHTDDLALRWHVVRDPDTGKPVSRVLLRAPTAGGPPEGDIPADGAGSSARPADDGSGPSPPAPAPPAPGFVRHFGYVSLFPVLLRLLPPDSPHLGATLARMGDRQTGLLSPAGLASLSPASTFRDARNTEHDAPYWRGAAWPPVNYLALAALDHYARAPGPHAAAAAALRDDVRAAFVGNVVAQASGPSGGGVCDVWERYSGGEAGTGLGPRPFTGWGSLVVLAAAGVYFEL